LAASLAELPAGPLVGVVLANELLDNLPFGLLERTTAGWAEVRVDATLRELLVPAPGEAAARAQHLAPDARPGARVPLQDEAAAWLREALATLERGRVAVFDYASDTPTLARRRWTEWVRTYRSHGRGGAPLDHLGDQDITCEVAVDQLASVRPPALDRSQEDFLRAHGIGELVDAARRGWRQRAHVGDLPALKARARVTEAEALLDSAGLGGFRAIEWAVP
jgi:SAM-dependent MidA family methyltransferase